jgi:hypothetical protein
MAAYLLSYCERCGTETKCKTWREPNGDRYPLCPDCFAVKSRR